MNSLLERRAHLADELTKKLEAQCMLENAARLAQEQAAKKEQARLDSINSIQADLDAVQAEISVADAEIEAERILGLRRKLNDQCDALNRRVSQLHRNLAPDVELPDMAVLASKAIHDVIGVKVPVDLWSVESHELATITMFGSRWSVMSDYERIGNQWGYLVHVTDITGVLNEIKKLDDLKEVISQYRGTITKEEI